MVVVVVVVVMVVVLVVVPTYSGRGGGANLPYGVKLDTFTDSMVFLLYQCKSYAY